MAFLRSLRAAFETDLDVRVCAQRRHSEILQLRQFEHRSHLDDVVNVVRVAKGLGFSG